MFYDWFSYNYGFIFRFSLKNSNYLRAGYNNAKHFIRDNDIKPWDYFKTSFKSSATESSDVYIYFIPPTSFNHANLQNCNFQGLDRFESFDFTKVKKD